MNKLGYLAMLYFFYCELKSYYGHSNTQKERLNERDMTFKEIQI